MKYKTHNKITQGKLIYGITCPKVNITKGKLSQWSKSTIAREVLQSREKSFPRLHWPMNNLHRKPFTTLECLDSSTIRIAFMDDAFVITIGNANQLQESFEGFLHNNKYVVGAMTSACSPTDAHIYMKLFWNGEFKIFLVT